MAKNHEAGKLISPANLWAKPLPRPTNKPVEKVTGMRTEDEDMDEDEVDVDAELADADSYEEEIEDDAEVVAETDEDTEAVAETDADVENDEDEVEDDGLTYAPEDGDEVAAEEEDEELVASNVGDDDGDEEDGETEETEEAVTTTESRTRSMADKKKVSLSDHIRTEIEKRKASGASLRGVDIVAALEKRSISVSPAQVSQLLKKAGVAGSKRGRKPAAVAPVEQGEKPRAAMKAAKKDVAEAPKPRHVLKRHTPAAPAAEVRSAPKAAKTPSSGFRVPMAQLEAAEAFVEACGGSFKNAERILTAAASLSQTFGN